MPLALEGIQHSPPDVQARFWEFVETELNHLHMVIHGAPLGKRARCSLRLPSRGAVDTRSCSIVGPTAPSEAPGLLAEAV